MKWAVNCQNASWTQQEFSCYCPMLKIRNRMEKDELLHNLQGIVH